MGEESRKENVMRQLERVAQFGYLATASFDGSLPKAEVSYKGQNNNVPTVVFKKSDGM